MSIHRTNDPKAIEPAILSDEPFIRATGRAAAAGWMQGFEDWARAEHNRPGADPAEIIMVAHMLFTQMLASLMAHAVDPEGYEVIAGHMADTQRTQIPRFATLIRARKEGAA